MFARHLIKDFFKKK